MQNVPNVSLKDTKETIFRAFQIAQQNLKDAAAGKLDIKAEEKAKLTAAAVDAASKLSVEDVENQILNLKRSTTSLLDDMATEFSGAVKSFNDVQSAVAAQEAKLKELFGIEEAAHALVALVNAKQAIGAEYDQNFAKRKAAAEAELNEVIQLVANERAQYDADLLAQQQADEQARNRKQTEWEYDFERSKRTAQDALADQLAAERKTFNVEMEAERAALAQDARELDAREETLDKREAAIEALETRVAGIPAEIEGAVRAAEGRLSGILKSQYESEKKLTAAENKAASEIKDNKIEALEATLEKANEEIVSLRDQLAKAQDNVKDMALKSIESSSDTKLAASLSRTVSELTTNKGTTNGR